MAKVRSETASAARGASRARGGGRRAGSAIKTTEGGWVGSTEQLYMVLQVYDHAHESPRVMTLPLVVLGVCSLCVAWGWPLYDAEASMLGHHLHHGQHYSVLADFGLIPELEEALPGRRAQREGSAPEGLVRFRIRATGEERWSLVRPAVVRAPGGQVQFVINSFHDVTALKETERRLTLLADAGSILGKSVDYQESLNELARMVVPQLADWCVVDVVEPESGLRRVAVAHEDASLVELAEEVQRRWPSNTEEGATGDVLKSGEPLLLPVITEEQLLTAARDEEHGRYLRALGLNSVAILPLTARGRVLGLLTLVRSDRSRAFGEEELPLLGELAARAGTAIDNSRLLHEATEAVRLRDDFLAIASHDMRTPLAAILGYLQLGLRRAKRVEEPGSEKLVEYLSAAESMAGRLTDLVADLMDVSLLRSGRPIALEMVELEVAPVLERVIDVHQKLARTHRFAFVHDAPVVVQADL